MINHKKIISDVLQGKAAEFLPFAPRLDIWHRSNKLEGTLPDEYKNATLFDVLDDLEIGYNTMIPDYVDVESEEETYDRGLDFIHTRTSSVFKMRIHNVKRTVEYQGNKMITTYETPHGTLSTATVHDEAMLKQGITIPAHTKKLIQSVDDFKAAAYIYENMEVIPTYDTYNAFVERIGNRGIATAVANQRESPMRVIQMQLMDYESFTYAVYDHPDELVELCKPIEKYLARCVDVSADSPAQLITCGAHFDSMITYPPFFEEHMLPYLQRYSELLHSKDKMMACHTDSDNEGLFDLYSKTGMDVADSICISPITNQSYSEIRQASKGKYVLYGVIPSVSTLKNTLDDVEFDRYINQLMQEISDDGAKGIILAVADTTPPGADINRIRTIAKLSKQIKPRD